jgi:hypothetical protein
MAKPSAFGLFRHPYPVPGLDPNLPFTTDGFPEVNSAR